MTTEAQRPACGTGGHCTWCAARSAEVQRLASPGKEALPLGPAIYLGHFRSPRPATKGAGPEVQPG